MTTTPAEARSTRSKPQPLHERSEIDQGRHGRADGNVTIRAKPSRTASPPSNNADAAPTHLDAASTKTPSVVSLGEAPLLPSHGDVESPHASEMDMSGPMNTEVEVPGGEAPPSTESSWTDGEGKLTPPIDDL